MKATKNPKRDKAKSQLQASTGGAEDVNTETLAKAKRGFKRPSDELEWVIQLVNSLPPDPPQVSLLTKKINTFSPDLKAYLDSEYDEAMADGGDSYDAGQRMHAAYLMVLDMSNALRELMREATEATTIPEDPDDITINFYERIDAGAYLEITNERTVRVRMSPLAQAVQGIEIDYLRYCKTCGKIFFAGRKNQQCCTVKCAKAQRQKRWRQRYKAGYYQGGKAG
jgi:hypothetical protein